jgi:hypothetical protein
VRKFHLRLLFLAFTGLSAAATPASPPAKKVVEATPILAALPAKLAGLDLYYTKPTLKHYQNSNEDSSVVVLISKLTEYPVTLGEAVAAAKEKILVSDHKNFRTMRSTKYPDGSGWYVNFSYGLDDLCENFSQQWLFDIGDSRIDVEACAASETEAKRQRLEVEKYMFGKVKLSPWVAKDVK